MKKLFLIPLVAFFACATAWAVQVTLITNADQLRAFLTAEGTAIGATESAIDMTDQSAITVVGTKTLTVYYNITNCNTSGLFNVQESASLTLLGTGTISGTGNYLFDLYGTMVVGVENGDGPTISAGYPIYMNNTTTSLTLNSGSLVAKSTYPCVIVTGTFTMNGGTISNTTDGSTGLGVSPYGTATINGGSISAKTDGIDNYGGLTINGGTISAGDGVYMIGDGPQLTMTGGTINASLYYGIVGNGSSTQNSVINISGGTVNMNGSEGVGIYHPQSGTLTISGGTITGPTGICVKSGTVSISGTAAINATGADTEYEYNSNGPSLTGDALVVDACNYPGGAPSITISAGTFTSAHADAVGNYTYQESTPATGAISGGTYSSEVPAELCAAGKGPKNNGNGTYGVAAYDYSRTVTAGNFGTICLNKAGKFYGGTLYNIADKGDNSIVLEEAGEEMVAGKPYIFRSNAATVYAMFSSETTADAGNANGLHGVYSQTDASNDWCVVYNNQYWNVNSDNVKVGANCAYFVLSEINAQANVPGRRRITMNANGTNTATGVDNVENAAQSVKMIENGQVIILRNGQKYNVAGQIVK